jgi:hypothetical protein
MSVPYGHVYVIQVLTDISSIGLQLKAAVYIGLGLYVAIV